MGCRNIIKTITTAITITDIIIIIIIIITDIIIIVVTMAITDIPIILTIVITGNYHSYHHFPVYLR